jgi:peptide/nickel transport system substrate-binding protein
MRGMLLGTAAAVAIGCGAGIGEVAAKTPADQLVVGMTLANVLQMDPHDNSAYEKTHIMIQVYDRLMEMRAEDESKLDPLLAESWSFDGEGNLVLQLRDDAVFHSGEKVTAEDVVYSLQRPLLGSLNAGNEYREVGFTPENVEELITAVDEHTVRIERPGDMNLVILMYAALAQPSGAIVEKDVVLANAVDGDHGYGFLKTGSAGSGRFELNRWNPNELILLDRFDDHWMGPAEMRRIIVRHIPEAQAQRLQLEQGDIDLAYTLNASDYASLDANPAINVQKVVGDGFYHIAMNTDHPILGDPKVRRAMRYLIPYDGLQQSVMTYFGEPWHWPIAQGKLGAMPEDLPVEYNPERAKELLAEAGYEEGVDLEILSLSQPPFAEIATVFQEGAAAADVRVKVTQGGGTIVYGQMRQRDFDMIVGRALGGKYGDPHSNVSNSMYNPDNTTESSLQNYAWRTSFQDEELNGMIEAAAAELDEAKRAELYHRIQQRYEELSPPFHMVGQRIDPFAVRAEVEGIVGHPSWTTRWDLARKN